MIAASVADIVRLVDEMIAELHEARMVAQDWREFQDMTAKRSALGEVLRRMRTGEASPRWCFSDDREDLRRGLIECT